MKKHYPTCILLSVLTLTLLHIPVPLAAEDGYVPVSDFEGYEQATVGEDLHLWLSSDWIRSADHGNWTETGKPASAPTFLVRDGVIYTGGELDAAARTCTFHRYAAPTGERLDDLVIDTSACTGLGTKGYVRLVEDDAGSVCMVGATGSIKYILDGGGTAVYTVDLASGEVTGQHMLPSFSNGFFYPAITGDVGGDDFDLWGVFQKTLTRISFPAGKVTVYKDVPGFSFSNSAEPSITPLTRDRMMVSASAVDPLSVFAISATATTGGKVFESSGTQPWKEGRLCNGISLLGHGDTDMAGLSAVIDGRQVFFIVRTGVSPSRKWPLTWGASWADGTDSYLLWRIPGGFPGVSTKALSAVKTVPAVGGTRLYVSSPGYGLAAYTIIGPGATTGAGVTVAGCDDGGIRLVGRRLRLADAAGVDVYDIHGRRVLHSAGCDEVSLSALVPGIYVARTAAGQAARLILH